MSPVLKVLVALVAGLALGLGVSASGSSALGRLVSVIEPVGTLWVAAIRMTIIPLVMSSLVLGVGGAADPRAIGRIGIRAIVLFIAMLTVATLFAILVAPPALGLFPLDPAAIESLRASAAATAGAATEGARKLPTIGQWIVDLVPVNPVKAAADGAMLPLIVFSLTFGIAITRIAADRRAALVGLAEAVQQASFALVRGILAVAPIGVFALAVGVAAKLGVSAVGALATYVVVVCSATTLFVAFVLYPAAVVLGGVPVRTFARGALPAQAVALSARSSLAALPAMLEGARTRLGLPAPLAGFLLPLAVTLFRVGAAIGQVIGALFIAALYGVTLGPAQFAAVGATVIATNFSIPGIPNGSILMIVPVLLAAGVPPEGVGLLLAVDTIPDMFRTTTNVTGDLVAAVILARRARGADGADGSDAATEPAVSGGA